MTSHWTRAHIAQVTDTPVPSAPRIVHADLGPRISALDLWDFWPVQEIDGRVARFGETELWMALSASRSDDPVGRHAHARIGLLERTDDAWTDRGDLLPAGLSPGSREWSGSAIVNAAHRRLTLFFTATGRRGEPRRTYEQRIFQTSAAVDGKRLSGWTPPIQSVASDGIIYHPAAQAEGKVGTIKAFRDPAFFRDPADGTDYLLFAASLGHSTSAFNGAVGLARGAGVLDRWTLEAPLIAADELNNELERPHIVVHEARYYLFWSTQRSVFAPAIDAPTGLYGMVADRMSGPYTPLNGSGLVFANPADAPSQSYSWLVSSTLEVRGFVDIVQAVRAELPEGSGVFGGTLAPALQLALCGSTATLVQG